MHVASCSFNITVNIWKLHALYSCVSGLEFSDNGRHTAGSHPNMVTGV